MPISTNSNKGLTIRTAYYSFAPSRFYKISYNNIQHVFSPVICLLYALKDGDPSYYIASLGGYSSANSNFKLICGNATAFKMYKRLNGTNYFDFILECPVNSDSFMEIKSHNNLTVSETTESLNEWQQIPTN